MSEDRIHHPFSPSSLQNREACPKYANRNSNNAAAIAGTIQHTVAETRLDDVRLSDRQAEAVTQCVAFVDEIAAKYPGGTVVQEVYLPVDEEMIVVENVIVTQFDIVTEDGQVSPGFRGNRMLIPFHGTTAGFLDYAVISADETEAEIVDFKYGKNAVTDAKDNLQGIAYMLGLKRIYPGLEKCKVTFLMPALDEEFSHTFNLTDTSELYLRVRTVVGRAVEASKNPDDFSAARPNVGTCLFCALVGKCPKVAELVIKLGQKYKSLEIPANVTPTTISDPKDVDMGIRLTDVVKTWAEAFRRQATEKTIENPDFVPEGYSLVTSQKRKIIKAKLVGELAKTFLPPEMHEKVEELYDLPLGGCEELIQTAAPRGQKEKTVDSFGAKILEAGAVELGVPFASLRQSTKKDKKTAAK